MKIETFSDHYSLSTMCTYIYLLVFYEWFIRNPQTNHSFFNPAILVISAKVYVGFTVPSSRKYGGQKVPKRSNNTE